MKCCRNAAYLICGLLLLALLGGCANYKSVVVEIHQDTTQKAGGSVVGGGKTG